MKKTLIACSILLVVFLLCAGSLFLLFRKEITQQFKSFFNSVSGESNAILLIDDGEAFIKTSEDGEYVEAEDQQELYEGSFIKTSEGSESHLILLNNSVVSLDQSTEIQLATLPTEKENETFIKQFVGNAWHRVGELSGTGSYEVETPNAIAAVRGTIFGTIISELGNDEIFSIENIVSVNDSEISENEFAAVNEESEVEITEIPDRITSSTWFERNKELDEIFKDIDFKNLNRKDLIDKYRDETGGGLFGNLIPSEDDILPVSDIEANSTATCDQIEGVDYDEIITLFRQYESYMNFGFDADELASFYGDIKEACADGFISTQEANKLSASNPF